MISQISEAHILASKARAKLTKEASRGDYDLRVLVGHANLLDRLMETIDNNEVADQTVQMGILTSAKNNTSKLPNRTTVTFVEDDDDIRSAQTTNEVHQKYGIQHTTSTTITYNSDEDSEDELYSDEDEDEDEDYEAEELEALRLSLTRTKSRCKFMPTLDGLSESEADDFEEEEEEKIEAQEVDITDLRDTPSLNYSSSSEDEDDLSIEDHGYIQEADFTEQGIWQKNNGLAGLISQPFLNERSAVIC